MTGPAADDLRRRAFESFVIAEFGKPAPGATARSTLAELARLQAGIARWTDDELRVRVVDQARLDRYEAVAWTATTAMPALLAAWPMMGGLPVEATRGSAADTADYIREHGVPRSAERLLALLAQADRDPAGTIDVCRALPLLVLPYAMVHGRPHERLDWAVDDGSHRAVTLARLTPSDPIPVLLGRYAPAADG